ncbi:MAG: sigma-70 family RNA polymerase sigma factor [Bacteroidia bacterium]
MLYDQYGAALYGVILKVVKSDSMAEDVLQESFVKIWNKIDQYDEKKGRFFTWILNIARNTAIDHWRSARRRQVVDIDAPAGEAATGGYEDAPDAAIDANKILTASESRRKPRLWAISRVTVSLKYQKTSYATWHRKNKNEKITACPSRMFA